jgi:hypothetical protein
LLLSIPQDATGRPPVVDPLLAWRARPATDEPVTAARPASTYRLRPRFVGADGRPFRWPPGLSPAFALAPDSSATFFEGGEPFALGTPFVGDGAEDADPSEAPDLPEDLSEDPEPSVESDDLGELVAPGVIGFAPGFFWRVIGSGF